MRLGGERLIALDVRVIAATNKNLREAIAQREFREDLYFRLSTFKLRVPTLQERRGDILPLVARLLARHASEGQAYRVSAQAQTLLMSYAWPGNVRELENVMLRAMVLCPDHMITHEHLMFDDAAPTAHHAARDFVETDLSTLITVNEQVRDVAVGRALHTGVKNSEQRLIQAALETTGTRNDAARKLGISPRTLRYKLAKLKGTTPELATSLEG
jgi:two-component system response regulator FlrC